MFKKLKQKIAEESEGEQSPRRQNSLEGQVRISISYTRECFFCVKVFKQSSNSHLVRFGCFVLFYKNCLSGYHLLCLII